MQISSDWSTPLLYGVAVLVVLELLLFVLRRVLPSTRVRALYHLWAVTLAVLTGLYLAGVERSQTGWQIVAATAALLSALVLFILLDVLLLQRPWAPDQPPMLPKLARDVLAMALLVTVGLLVAKEVLDQPLGAVLVSSTVLSAVVGLALQDVLKNVFAGMALDIEKPLARGDWLLLDGHTPAEIVDVSWRSVRLRTNEGVLISEPNANVASARIVNYGSGSTPRAFGFRVGLPYEAPPTQVKEALLAAARSVHDALDRPAPRVFLESYDDHSIRYYLRVWTLNMRSMRAFQDRVNTRIWYQLKRRGLYVPFPIRTLHMHDAEQMEERHHREDRERSVRLLSRLDLLREFEPSAIRELAAGAEHYIFDDGEVLVREGDSGDSLFVIEEGSVVVSKRGEEGGEVELARLEAGDFYGERSLLTGEDRSATVVSAGGCRVLELKKKVVAPILEQDPEIVAALSRALAARQADTSDTLESHRDLMSRRAAQQAELSMLGKIRAFFKLG